MGCRLAAFSSVMRFAEALRYWRLGPAFSRTMPSLRKTGRSIRMPRGQHAVAGSAAETADVKRVRRYDCENLVLIGQVKREHGWRRASAGVLVKSLGLRLSLVAVAVAFVAAHGGRVVIAGRSDFYFDRQERIPAGEPPPPSEPTRFWKGQIYGVTGRTADGTWISSGRCDRQRRNLDPCSWGPSRAASIVRSGGFDGALFKPRHGNKVFQTTVP